MNKKLLIIIIAAAVVLIGAGVAVYFIFFTGGGEEEVEVFIPTSYYTPGEFTVTNTYDSGKLIKYTLVLALKIPEKEAAAVNDTLTLKQHIIRDTAIFLVREKKLEELITPGYETQLRSEILNALKQRMPDDMQYLVGVYFSDYALQ